MPRNSSGTYTTPAGQPVVSGTVISAATENTLVSDISTEITDSLSRSGKGGMNAPIRTPDGAVSAPAHSFTNETGTGLYRIGASDVGLAVSGTKRLEITGSGVTVPDTLDVRGAGGITVPFGNVTFSNTATQAIAKSGGTLQFGTSDANEVDLYRNNSIMVRLLSGAISAETNPIQNVTDPTNAQDAATKNYIDVTAGTAAATASALMRRDANGRTAVATPSATGDAATKGYVDGGGAYVAKAWALLTLGGAGAVTITAGHGVGSASWSGNSLTVGLSPAMGSANYATFATVATVQVMLAVGITNSSQFIVYQTNSAGSVNWANGQVVSVLVFAG